MRLGMFMHPLHDFKRGYHTLLNEDRAVIKCADALGFDEVWLGEHHTVPSEPVQSALLMFATMIPETERITFGTAVHCLPYYHPAMIANWAAQFDHLAQGRFYMGIGVGGTPTDFELFNVADKDRMEMVIESIEMIHGIWASDPPYAFHGKHWDFEVKGNLKPHYGIGGMAKPYQKPHPPVMIPALSRGSGSVRTGVQRSWQILSANFIAADVVKGHWREQVAECEKLGRRPDPSLWRAGRTLLVTDTDEDARAYLRRPDCALRWYFEWVLDAVTSGKAAQIMKSDADLDMPDDELSVDYCLDNLVIAGSPKTVVEKLVEFRDHVGPFETLICSHHDWVHETLWRRHMELLATEVMPRFRCAIG